MIICPAGGSSAPVAGNCSPPGILTVLSVDYQVEGKTYRIKETMKVKGEAIKVGKVPIGQRKKPVLGDIKKGDQVSVQYDTTNPRQAIIVGNDGSRTS